MLYYVGLLLFVMLFTVWFMYMCVHVCCVCISGLGCSMCLLCSMCIMCDVFVMFGVWSVLCVLCGQVGVCVIVCRSMGVLITCI